MNETIAGPVSGPGAVPHEAVWGPSFPVLVKALATVLMVALVGVGASVLLGAPEARPPAASEWGFVLAGVAVVAAGYWGILTSRTGFDGECIEQTWLWRKKVRIAEISQVKLIHVPALSWLIAPRLVVRTGGITVTTFHAADPAVLQAFRRLAYG